MKTREKIFEELIDREGGYVNDPKDSGGETKYGITKRVARKYGWNGSMIKLPKDIAIDIYKRKYWDKLNLDTVYRYSPEVAEEMFDTAVNMGTGRAGKFLQRALNLLMDAELVVDGIIGIKTLAVLDRYAMRRGDDGKKVLLKMLNSMQGAFYVSLAEQRSKDKRFIYGWFKNRVS